MADASSLKLGRLYEVSRDGEVTYECEKWLEVEGSYSGKVRIRRNSPHRALLDTAFAHGLVCPSLVYEVSGNPSKFLQGHNCFGVSADYLGPMLEAMTKRFPGDVRPKGCVGLVHPSRVDVTVMVDMRSHKIVHEWLRHAERETRSRHGRALVSGDTVYWGKHSRRWSLKAYCKLCELQQHPPGDPGFVRLVCEFLEGQLRLELTLRTLELKKVQRISESLVWEYLKKIAVGVMKVRDWASCGLNWRDRLVLQTWLAGEDVRREMHRQTFYRIRRRILDKVGVDISLSPVPYDEQFPRLTWDLEWLKEHEAKSIPAMFDGYLWRPE